MHQTSVALRDKLKQSIDINSAVRLIAEWNMNRYAKVSSVTNGTTPIANEYDNDVFPITSIVEPERPTQGILKAVATTTVGGVGADAYTADGYRDRVLGGRWTTASSDNKYKYWTSKNQSAAASPYAITEVSPTVLYESSVWTNKIYVCFEGTYAKPSQYTIQVSTNGTTWSTVATNAVIDDKGRVQIYRQSNGTWSSTPAYDYPTQIRGVRVVVTNMDAGLVRFNLIELGARLESDLSTFVESYTSNMNIAETSFITPIGKASSNVASVDLDNSTGRFTNDNPSSLYFNLLDKNVEMRMDVGINIGTYDAPNFEWVRQFTMRTESWGGQNRDGTSVDLKDASDYLQSIKPNPTLFMEVTVGEAIWMLLDSVGFSAWKYERTDIIGATVIPQIWFDGEKTVWEEIQALAEATQTAVYFDEYGVLQIKTRDTAYDIANSPVWTLDEVKNGTKQPDIVELTNTYDYEANVVNISYRETALSKENEGGIPVMESVWEPESTLTLRSSQLVANFLAGATAFLITPDEANIWPYDGMVQIDGEIVKYEAKQYTYFTNYTTKASKWVKTEDERKALDKLSPETLRYQNKFSGYMKVAPNGRGYWNTVDMDHKVAVDMTRWNIHRYRTGVSGTIYNWAGGFYHDRNKNCLTLKTPTTFGKITWYVNTVNAEANPTPVWYGTRFKFAPSGYNYGAAGIIFCAGSNDQGYYVELVRTEGITPAERGVTHELCFYTRTSTGAWKRIGPDGGKGVPVNVAANTWYDMDVNLSVEAGGATHRVSVFINGVPMMNIPLTGTQRLTLTGRNGLFTRGNTIADFEYYYSSTAAATLEPGADLWWSRIKGGYQSAMWDRELTYGAGSSTAITKQPSAVTRSRSSARFFDDFGPVVQEIREFDVKFSKTPVLYSNLYLSNESQVACIEYVGNAFGARFVLANVSRQNAVASGEDTLTFGIDNPVEQKTLIYGRTFPQEDQKTHTVRDEAGIKRRGEVAVDIDSQWIQSKTSAEALGEWIVAHWSSGADEAEVEVFGNPLLQLLDVVDVNMPSKSMSTATHKYFVTQINQSYSEGLTTKFTIRRKKI